MDVVAIPARIRRGVLVAAIAGALASGCWGGRAAGGGRDRAGAEAGPGSARLDPSAISLRRIGTWEAPVQLVAIPGTDQVAVVEQGGRVRVEDPASSAGGRGHVVLDLRREAVAGGEQGLLGLVFHPDWPRDDRIFVDYTARADGGATHIVQLHLHDLDGVARRPDELLRIEQPYENHNGGALAVSGGRLFVGMGDGGSGGDPQDRAQDPDQLLGKVLRIDVDAHATATPGDPMYVVPDDNPFAVGGGQAEVWAIGVRNPWRFSIDAKTGLLWIGDVGQDAREEVDAIPVSGAGANLGWDVREGTRAHRDAGAKGPGRFTEPVFDYGRDMGCSVTGGVVYRGRAVPALAGRYVFGDFCSDRLWALDAEAVSRSGRVRRELVASPLRGVDHASSFGVDDAGELYVVSLDGGIFAVEAAGR